MGIVEQLEGAIDIVELVSKYTNIKKAGVNYKGLCPFPGHNEKTPSFMVSPSKQIAYCFGCHKGGGPVKFMMDIENSEFKEAIEVLGSFTGIQVNTNFDTEKFKAQKNLYSLYKDATNYYASNLEKYPEIKKYLMERGINDESIKNFHLGYSDNGLALYSYLKEKGYTDQMMTDSNIFLDVKTKKDKFINRVIFPIQNQRGDFVGYTARILGSGEPKYLNSPASDIYDKSGILYGLFTAKTGITKKDFIIVTEGNADTIALQQEGFFNSVAVSGTALTDKHIAMIKRLTHKIYLCFDKDTAGEKATKSALEILKNKGLEVRIITLKGGKDPDEVLKNGGDFQKLIDEALSPIGYYIENSHFNTASIEEKKKLLTTLLEVIKSYSDNIEKDFYLKEISKRLDINEKIIYDMFNRTRFKSQKSIDDEGHTVEVVTGEDLAIGYIILDDKNKDYFKEHIVFQEGIKKDLKQCIEEGSAYINTLELNKKERYRGISLKLEMDDKQRTEDNHVHELEKLVVGLNRDVYKSMVAILKQRMKSGDDTAFLTYSELVKKAKNMGIK